MDKITYEALTQSVAKWRRNATVTPDQGTVSTSDCPLCRLHFHNGCIGCPIRNATGRGYCRGTPYESACSAWHSFCGSERDSQREHFDHWWRVHAQSEADFLAALVPAGGPNEEEG